ncbi:MAG: SpoIIE family protein phosphatase [Candidatus Sericytochromatia bacterium]|nr:SpoIIE family protein phosphatase [Candidatus Tanganyikabacteria bacterium]
MKQGSGRKATPFVFIGILILVALIDVLAVLAEYRWVGVPRPGFLVNDAMRVVAVQDRQSGIRVGSDVVLRIDGQDVSRPWDLQYIVDASGDFAVHEYLIARPGGEATASVTSRFWTAGDSTGRIAIPLALSLLFVAVACLAFWKARMQDASAPLIAFCGVMAVLPLAPFLPLGRSSSPEPWMLAFFPFTIATLVHLTMGYPAPWRGLKDRPWLRYVPYGAAGVIALLALLVYPGIRSGGSSALTSFTTFIGALGWLMVLVGGLVTASNLFETARRSAAPGARVLARIELEAAVAAFLPLALLSGLVWLWPHPALAVLTDVSRLLLPLFPLGILAGLARFKIIQVQKWYEYAAIGVLSAAGLVLVYAPGVALLAYVSSLFGWDDSAAQVTGTVSATVLCPLVINWTRRLLDWLFERRKADFGQVVGEFAQAIRHLVKADDLLRAFMARSEQAFQPRYLLVFWQEEGEEFLTPKFVLGIAQERARPLKPDDPSFPRYVGAFALKGIDPAARGERQAKGMAIALRPELDGPAQALVAIGPRRSGEAFGPDDFELMTLLGDQLQVGLEHVRLIRQVADQEKLRHELEIARQVQMGLLPKRLPTVAGMEVSGSSEPALEVGGDLYDVVELEGGRVGILVGDVSGKGMPAALLMSTALACFRTAYMRYDSPAALLTRMNEVVAGNRPKEDMFVAICYAIWEPAGRLIISNGGMPMPLLNGEELKVKGPPLGMMQGYSYRESEVPMNEGDLLLFWSDGLEDVHEERGKTFGVERIIEIARKGGFTAEGLRSALLESCLAFRGNAVPFDDITIVTARSVPAELSAIVEPMAGAYA